MASVATRIRHAFFQHEDHRMRAVEAARYLKIALDDVRRHRLRAFVERALLVLVVSQQRIPPPATRAFGMTDG